MRILRYRETIAASANLSEEFCLRMKVQNHQRSTIALYASSTNVRIKVKYVFDSPDGNATKSVTACTVAASVPTAGGAVYTSASHGYAVGDVVAVTGSAVQGYETDSIGGVITAVVTNTFTIAEKSTLGLASFSGTANVRYIGSEALIQTVDLTSGTLVLLNFDMKLGHLVITRDDVGSVAGGGELRIDATVA